VTQIPRPHGSQATIAQPASDEISSAPSLEISNAMVWLYKQAFGRGPTKARTAFAGPDTLLVVLEDVFTATERTLFALGEIEPLREARLAIQSSLEERARSAVERALRRQTLAFVTGVDPSRAVAMNLFTLEPIAV
jgi:uncharacterized protein YbcI